MKIYRHCESDKKLWLNTRSLLKNIKSSKYIYLKLDLLYDFQQIPKYESQTAAFYDVQLDFPINYEAMHSASGVTFLFCICIGTIFTLCSFNLQNIIICRKYLNSFYHGGFFLLFTFYFCPPWLRHVSGNFSRQDRKFHNGCLSAGNPRLNFYNYFCKAWCNVLKW